MNCQKKQMGKNMVRKGMLFAGLVVMTVLLTCCTPKGSQEDTQPVLPPTFVGVKNAIEVSGNYTIEQLEQLIWEGVSVQNATATNQELTLFCYDAEGNFIGKNVGLWSPGTYSIQYALTDPSAVVLASAKTKLTVLYYDGEPPVIEGAVDLTVEQGGTIAYREGVTATDNIDGSLPLTVDSSAVDLNTPGTYQVTYIAVDANGNRTEVSVNVTVTAVEEPEPSTNPENPNTPTVTEEQLYGLCDWILERITTPEMTQYEKAKAIYDYVLTSIKYVGTSDKSSWITGAYVGFSEGKGDCFNYFACSKALLTRAGIPNVDLTRVGGPSRHYWQLVDVGEGYYHFDACPHSSNMPLYSFMLTEEEVQEFTARRGRNYYVYDYANCPVPVVLNDAGDTSVVGQVPFLPVASETPATPEVPVEPADPVDPAVPEVPVDPAAPETVTEAT